MITVEDCKAFRGIELDNKEHDAELARLVTAVESYLEKECARKFAIADVTEFYSGCDWKTMLLVQQPPIITIANIWDDPSYAFATPLASTYYKIYDAEAGLIKLLYGVQFTDGIQNIKISYNGGFTNDLMPPDLKEAAIELVWAAREKGVHNLIGVRSRSVADGSSQYVNLDWPMNLAPIIDKYSIRSKVL